MVNVAIDIDLTVTLLCMDHVKCCSHLWVWYCPLSFNISLDKETDGTTMPWQRIRRLFPMELQSFGDKSLKWYRHKILANNHIDSAAAAVVSKMTWHDPSTSLKFSSFSMRDLKRPLKRITCSKIRVFSQNWFCGGDICVSGLICLSCSLLVTFTLQLVTSIHSWMSVSNKYVST